MFNDGVILNLTSSYNSTRLVLCPLLNTAIASSTSWKLSCAEGAVVPDSRPINSQHKPPALPPACSLPRFHPPPLSFSAPSIDTHFITFCTWLFTLFITALVLITLFFLLAPWLVAYLHVYLHTTSRIVFISQHTRFEESIYSSSSAIWPSLSFVFDWK